VRPTGARTPQSADEARVAAPLSPLACFPSQQAGRS
jgi:hypothetical protein